MKEKSVSLKSNLKKVDKHKIGKKEYEEIPELPPEFFTKGQLYENGKPVQRRVRGKQKKPTKILKTIRFDQEVIDFFQKEIGNGWQTEMNNVLVNYVRAGKKRRKRA